MYDSLRWSNILKFFLARVHQSTNYRLLIIEVVVWDQAISIFQEIEQLT